jgi:hypothetical protein
MIINLGPDCQIAGILKKYNILEHRSPFDSVITSHKSLIDCLNNKFENFCNEFNFRLYFDIQSPLNIYNIVLAHNFELMEFNYKNLEKIDFIKKVEEITKLTIDEHEHEHSYEYYLLNINNPEQKGYILNFNNEKLNIVKEKYKRRIDRFNEAMNSQELCYLYRSVNDINEMIEIKNVLLKNYNNKNFKLIFITRNINLKKFKYDIEDNFILAYNNIYYNKINEEDFYCKMFFDIEYNNKKGSFFKNTLNKLNNNYDNNMKLLINPLSMYLIADYYYGTEPDENNLFKNDSKNIYKNKNLILNLEDYNIIAVQGGPTNSSDWIYNFYDDFCMNILEKINKKIILIIGHYSLTHFINYDNNFKKINENNNILLCFIQNNGMINNFLNYDKIKSFPFGFSLDKTIMNEYVKILINNNIDDNINNKNITVEHLNLGMSWSSRSIFPIVERTDPEIFFNKMNNAKFLISPCGDRWDTYRNYECIGLNTIPICHKGALSKIFSESMFYICNDKNIYGDFYINILDNDNDEKKMNYMCKLIKNSSILEDKYILPNKDIITVEYWKYYINYIIKLYK